jgi:alkanesulfonate monooxygenase SsuD/methylene tetrahydromethanopterin reductase-like flavin-dependent oxidoreductase (luciferase family)
MTTLGAVFLPQFPPERLRSVALAADSAGLEELWLWEDCFREGGLTSAAAALAFTSSLRVGIGLLPMPLRNVALTAMEIATIDRLFPGRLHTGVGHGVLDWMGQVGSRVDSPLTLMREYIPALKSLLRGDEVTVAGRYINLDKVKLDWPPSRDVSIFAGAEGPKTLQLTGEVADGTILPAGTSPDAVRRARTLIDEGRSRGTATEAHPVVVYVLVATGDRAEERMDAELGRWNFDSRLDLAITGDASTVAAGVRRWADAGADTIVLQPTLDADPEHFVDFVAREVRPLVGDR